MDISVVVPTYFSSSTLEHLTRRLLDVFDDEHVSGEIIFVDDGSLDDTWTEVERLARGDRRVTGIKFIRNFGQHKAILAGLQESKGTWVAVMDADLQDRPEDVGEMYRIATETKVDAVIAKRIGKSSSIGKRVSSNLFHVLFSRSTGVGTKPGTGNFGLYHRRIIDTISMFGDQEFLFAALVESCKPIKTYVELERDERTIGASQYSFRKRLQLALSAFLWNSNGALKATLTIGVLFATIGIVAGLALVIDRLSNAPSIPGWTSMIVAILVSNGLILVSLGTLGIYVGKIFEYTKGRPRFVIEKITDR